MSRHYLQVASRAGHSNIPLGEIINMLRSSRTRSNKAKHLQPRATDPKPCEGFKHAASRNWQRYTYIYLWAQALTFVINFYEASALNRTKSASVLN
jgi:hypothetical protein